MGILDLFRGNSTETEGLSRLKRWEANANIRGCCENKISTSLTIDDHAIEFMSMFIDADAKKRWIIIDSLIPKVGNEYIKKSKSLYMSYNLNNVAHSFRSNYLGSVSGEFPSIRISFPKAIESHQKRAYFRVEPSINESVPITIKINKEPPLEIKGPVRDISEGGVSITILPDIVDRFKPGTFLDEIDFILPQWGDIKTKGVVKTISEAMGNRYHCGIEFVELTDLYMDKIYRYVVHRQREELQKLDKM